MQVLFYANSGNVGTDGQTFVSLYLWCEVSMLALDLHPSFYTRAAAHDSGEGDCGQWKVSATSSRPSWCRYSMIRRRWSRDGLFNFGFEIRK